MTVRAATMIAATLAVLSGPASADEGSAALIGDSRWAAPILDVAAVNHDRGKEASDPITAPMELCAAPGCTVHRMVVLDTAARQQLEAVFFAPVENAWAERGQAARAVGLMERLVADQLGTAGDLPANGHNQGPDDDPAIGQLDCVAEAANTLSYLDRLAQAGWLPRHRVGPPVIRFSFLLQHVAASLAETGEDETVWVVDSWPGANGAEPEVSRYDDWRGDWRV